MTESKKVREKRLKLERDKRLNQRYIKQGLKVKRVLIPIHLWKKYFEMGAEDVEKHIKNLNNKKYREKLGLPDPDSEQ